MPTPGIDVAGQNTRQGYPAFSDKCIVLPRGSIGDRLRGSNAPWVLQITAVALEEPSQLVRILTGGILGCGGWVLSRGASDTGRVSLLFEFERHACLDIYTVLVASGIELSQSGHVRFTQLCQCTRLAREERGSEIASVDLEVQTYPFDEPSCELALTAE